MVERRPIPATPQELGDIELLTSMMGGNLDPALVLNLLRKHNHNLEKTATALLEGETSAGDDVNANVFADLPQLEPLDAPMPGPRTPPPSRPEKAVIDLTKDDDDSELKRALQMSLEDHSGATTFGPSDRPPDPNWAMVPSNVEAGAPSGMSQDEQAMSRAIEASLSYNLGEDTYHELPLEERLRKGDTPVALRPTLSNVVYAALVAHALFFIPQIRNALARWMPLPEPDATEVTPPTAGPAHQVWTILEILVNMDLARISELNVDEALNAFATDPWSSPAERPGDMTIRFYDKLVYAVENVLQYNNVNNPERKQQRLLALQYGQYDAEPDDANTDNLCCVKVTVGPTPELNDLVSSLAAELAPPESPTLKSVLKRHVIFEPSEVIAFQLLRDSALPAYDAAVGRRMERSTFRYPKSIYLDQFMRESYALANEKRTEQRRLMEEVKELEGRKKTLLHFDDKDTLADLQSCLYYYENVVEEDDDPKRADEIRSNKEALPKIIEKIKEEAKVIDSTINHLRTEAQGMLECPELQKHRYDLRVALVHDGLYGRDHLYSYVKQKGKWWKTVDYSVTEVSEETVLTDSAGLHLGAGPYFLLYSRTLSQDEEDARAEWPENIKDGVKHNNKAFFKHLPPDIAAHVVDPNSPPSSPYVPLTPSEPSISSDDAEPSRSPDELMDMD